LFRLARVLDWKERLEKEARAERLAAEARAAELVREADRMRTRRHGLPDEGPRQPGIGELAAWARHADLLRQREQRARARLEAMREELSRARATHVAARSEVESFRRLEERWFRHEKRRRERRMQEVVDEAAARRFLPGTGRMFPNPPAREAGDGGPDGGEAASGTALPSPSR
jgi:hypothetical protein